MFNITIEDIIDLLTEPCFLSVYDMYTEEYVYQGWSNEITSDLINAVVESIDAPNEDGLTINVEADPDYID